MPDNNKKKYFIIFLKSSLILFLTSVFFVGLYFLLKYTGWIGTFRNVQELKLIIQSAGMWSYSVFVVLQFLQVCVLPLPGSITTIVGVILFGPLKAFILSTLAILAGSLFAYMLGVVFGVKIIDWIIGTEERLKFQKKMEKGKYIFFLMMLFPFFPDDILCMIAGMTNMKFSFFLYTNLITRPVGLFCICFLGSGFLSNLKSMWYIVLALFIVIVITFIILYNKNKKFKSLIENIFK